MAEARLRFAHTYQSNIACSGLQSCPLAPYLPLRGRTKEEGSIQKWCRSQRTSTVGRSPSIISYNQWAGYLHSTSRSSKFVRKWSRVVSEYLVATGIAYKYKNRTYEGAACVLTKKQKQTPEPNHYTTPTRFAESEARFVKRTKIKAENSHETDPTKCFRAAPPVSARPG